MQLKIAVQGLDIPAMIFEGYMADERKFDEGRAMRLIEFFVTKTLGLKKVT